LLATHKLLHQKAALLERAQRLRVRLGGSVDLTQSFPAKPKGRHFFTYMSLPLFVLVEATGAASARFHETSDLPQMCRQ
jgi:hypothetical protein